MPTKDEEVAAIHKFLADSAAAPNSKAKIPIIVAMFNYLSTAEHIWAPKFIDTIKDRLVTFLKEPEFVAVSNEVVDKLCAKLYQVDKTRPYHINGCLESYEYAADLLPELRRDKLKMQNQSVLIFKFIKDKNIDELRNLLDSGAFLTTFYKNETPLTYALQPENFDINIVKLLIERGGNALITMRTYMDTLPIYLATVLDNTEIVNELVNKGAVLEAKLILQAKSIAMIDFFLEKGASLESKDSRERTVLNNAITQEYDDLFIKHIIEKGANLNTMDFDENTPLHHAVMTKNIAVVKLLVLAGANQTLKNLKGLTALQIAKLNNLDDIVAEFAPVANNIFTNLTMNNYVPPALNANPSVPFDSYKLERVENMLIMTIPKGTLLYNSHTMDKAMTETSALKMYGGTLPMSTTAKVEGDELVLESCIDQFSGKFFYSNPAGGPGLGSVTTGEFNICNVFETKRPMRFAVLMTPSNLHRKVGEHPDKVICSDLPVDVCDCTSTEPENENNYNENNYDPYYENYYGGAVRQRAGKQHAGKQHSVRKRVDKQHAAKKRAVRQPAAKQRAVRQHGGELICPYAFDYDVCLKPEFLHRLQLDGHIAIAGEDSYEERMAPFESRILFESAYDKEYKKLTRILYNGGRSVDDRTEYGAPVYTGFPELVIQIFGTDWYGSHKSKDSTHRIPLTPGHTLESRIKIISKYLLDYNYDVLPDIEFKTPLRLLGISTAFGGYFDLVNGGNKALGFPTASAIDTFYLHFLKNYFDGSLRFYFDTRNGFLIRETAPIYVRMPDGSDKSFLELCKMGGEAATGKTALEITAAARRAGGGPWAAADCLVPAVKKQAAGRRRSRRMMTNNGTRKQKLNMLTEPLGTPAALKSRNMPQKAPNKTRRRARAPPSKLRPHELSADAVKILHIMLEVVRENQEIIQSYK